MCRQAWESWEYRRSDRRTHPVVSLGVSWLLCSFASVLRHKGLSPLRVCISDDCDTDINHRCLLIVSKNERGIAGFPLHPHLRAHFGFSMHDSRFPFVVWCVRCGLRNPWHTEQTDSGVDHRCLWPRLEQTRAATMMMVSHRTRRTRDYLMWADNIFWCLWSERTNVSPSVLIRSFFCGFCVRADNCPPSERMCRLLFVVLRRKMFTTRTAMSLVIATNNMRKERMKQILWSSIARRSLTARMALCQAFWVILSRVIAGVWHIWFTVLSVLVFEDPASRARVPFVTRSRPALYVIHWNNIFGLSRSTSGFWELITERDSTQWTVRRTKSIGAPKGSCLVASLELSALRGHSVLRWESALQPPRAVRGTAGAGVKGSVHADGSLWSAVGSQDGTSYSKRRELHPLQVHGFLFREGLAADHWGQKIMTCACCRGGCYLDTHLNVLLRTYILVRSSGRRSDPFGMKSPSLWSWRSQEHRSLPSSQSFFLPSGSGVFTVLQQHQRHHCSFIARHVLWYCCESIDQAFAQWQWHLHWLSMTVTSWGTRPESSRCCVFICVPENASTFFRQLGMSQLRLGKTLKSSLFSLTVSWYFCVRVEVQGANVFRTWICRELVFRGHDVNIVCYVQDEVRRESRAWQKTLDVIQFLRAASLLFDWLQWRAVRYGDDNDCHLLICQIGDTRQAQDEGVYATPSCDASCFNSKMLLWLFLVVCSRIVCHDGLLSCDWPTMMYYDGQIETLLDESALTRDKKKRSKFEFDDIIFKSIFKEEDDNISLTVLPRHKYQMMSWRISHYDIEIV